MTQCVSCMTLHTAQNNSPYLSIFLQLVHIQTDRRIYQNICLHHLCSQNMMNLFTPSPTCTALVEKNAYSHSSVAIGNILHSSVTSLSIISSSKSALKTNYFQLAYGAYCITSCISASLNPITLKYCTL